MSRDTQEYGVRYQGKHHHDNDKKHEFNDNQPQSHPLAKLRSLVREDATRGDRPHRDTRQHQPYQPRSREVANK